MGKFAAAIYIILACGILLVAFGATYGQELPSPQPSAPPTTPTPTPSPPRTPFFGDLEDRFSIIAAGHRLLRNSYDIDRVVGDPHALRPETMAAFQLIPDRMKLNLARLLADRAALLYFSPAESVERPESAGNTISLAATSDMSDQFQNAAKDAFAGAFRDDQLIDFGVFLLSKAPFFPKDKEGWEKWKLNIVTYDIYLALAFVAVTAATDNGKIGAAGWLYKSEKDEYRIGWYGGLEQLGFKFKPAGNLGIKWRSETAEMTIGMRANAADGGEKFAWEWGFVEHWFSKFVRPVTGWEAQASVGARYVMDHSDPAQAKIGSIGGNLFAKRPDLWDVKSLVGSFGVSAGANSKGHRTASASALLENQRSNIIGTLSFGYDTAGLVIDPRFPEQKRNWKLGAFIGGPTEDAFSQLAAHVKWSAARVESDLAEVARAKREFDGLVKKILRGEAVTEEQEEMRKFWLGLARLYLRRHLPRYEAALARYNALRRADEATLDLLGPSAIATARLEAAGDTFGVENHRLFIDGLSE